MHIFRVTNSIIHVIQGGLLVELKFDKEFDPIIEKAKSLDKPIRAVVAGANAENILKGLFAAQDAGFVYPVLVGNERKIRASLDSLGFSERRFDLLPIDASINPVQFSIEMINAGSGDVLVRGNTQTRDFLLPVLNKLNHFIDENSLVTHVVFLKIPGYDRLLGVSDVTLLFNPPADARKKVAVNLVKALNLLGVEHPNIALLALIESPAFHMRDTVEDQTIVRDHKAHPIADCELVGPISYDLIISKEAARLKGYDCPYCGEFDGIVVPNLLSGNLIVKVLEMNAGARAFGVLMGTKVPVSISGRSEAPEDTFLSLAACAAMIKEKQSR